MSGSLFLRHSVLLNVKVGQPVAFVYLHQRTEHNNNLLKRPSLEMSTKTKCDDEKADVNTVKHAVKGPAGCVMAKYLLDTKECSLAATIACMRACDGLPFQVFCSSSDLRKALLAMGFSDLLKSLTST